jgi:two-component system cell cycle response regulator DivK
MGKPFALIVEDDIELSDIFSVVLRASGMDTEIVRDGKQALGRINATMPDVVVLDMHLPNVSGLEILAEVRANLTLRGLRVVVVTADALLAKASEDQADMTLLKPVSFSQISDITSRLVQRAQ